MAERKANVPSSSANLLFSTTPEFNFNLPFIPVSQATDPAVLSGDDASEVGEEDSFLGQTSSTASQPSTLSYFTASGGNGDPFASLGPKSYPPPASSVGPTVAPSLVSTAANLPPTPPISGVNSVQQYGNVVHQNPITTHTSLQSAMPTPPPQASQQPFNPYRHTATSSKASPYIMAPELQNQPPHQAPQHFSMYSQTPPPVTFQSAPPTFTQPPPPQVPPPPLGPNMAGSVVPANPMMQYSYNVYERVQPHWFYCKQVESKNIWLPFSVLDSMRLEETFNSVQPDPENVIVSTDGGRYDVQLYDRSRTAVYWEEEPTEVRRCTWFYKGDTDSRFIPYSEEFSEKLEVEYKKAVCTNQWHRRLEFPSGETIVMHNPKVIVQFQATAMPDEWGTTQDGQTRPRVVKRGVDDDHDDIPDGEMPQVDHLVFMVHGIGPVCDLRFRSMVECVDDFRSVSLKLLQSHFKKALDDNVISRVEFLPVHWHTALHGDATGVDRRIKMITLPSTVRLRHFTNETLLDVLFYNSPTYCQTIMDTVAFETNRLYELFMQRNPNFKGSVSVAGHSLGSLILFDLLSNQKNSSSASTPNGNTQPEVKQASPPVPQGNEVFSSDAAEGAKEEEEEISNLSAVLEQLGLSEYLSTFEQEKMDVESLAAQQAAAENVVPKDNIKEVSTAQNTESVTTATRCKVPVGRLMSSMHVDYNCFEAGTGQVSVVYHALDFNPVNFFALGSPIGMFLTVRGVEKLEENYQFPTCKGFFNIYHPLDPVAYRIEPMILPTVELEPVLIPHHKGRKRLHLELKESLSRMGSDLKQGFISSLRTAWQTLHDFARAHTSSIKLHEQLAIVASQIKEEEEMQKEVDNKLVMETLEPTKEEETQVKVGMLNGGRRIDYVLQEKPIESFNEYLFALQSHLCYWESEDTALFFLKEIYRTMDIWPEQTAH
ncbi:SEC23-interacting protein [Bagarius yarrelli]|uniref:SEC23-interacting protein n=1 Tax=Bagarius yarrelli TaxID=175774 RepID=A0A556TMW7_BAGYA|nr:SEC23-interacting protein [Bagarius yarrelli]